MAPQWDTARKVRSIFLRFVAFVILLTNFILGGSMGAERTPLAVPVIYFTISIALVAATRLLPNRTWLKIVFVVFDATLMTLVLYAHILSRQASENHNLTTTGLVIAFILLTQVALELDRKLIVIFSGLVLTSWVAMLATIAVRHRTGDTASVIGSFFNRDLGLTVSFAFAAFAIYLLARDHDHTRKEGLRADKRRLNLSGFFSPLVVEQLQETGSNLGLERRDAAIMFIDLRDFTRFAETASADELTFTLTKYRQLVSRTIIEYGGTIDKFIGDGVMVVFGQPQPSKYDADRAIACALELVNVLSNWRNYCLDNGYPSLEAGIGLHYGTVISGVLDSGCHNEFTVVGDAVNVAERLESLAKSLGALLVVSCDLMLRLRVPIPPAEWLSQSSVALPGRRLLINVRYICRLPYQKYP